MKIKKTDYVAPHVTAISLDMETLMQTVSFDPNEKGELDSKGMNVSSPTDSNDDEISL